MGLKMTETALTIGIVAILCGVSAMLGGAILRAYYYYKHYPLLGYLMAAQKNDTWELERKLWESARESMKQFNEVHKDD